MDGWPILIIGDMNKNGDGWLHNGRWCMDSGSAIRVEGTEEKCTVTPHIYSSLNLRGISLKVWLILSEVWLPGGIQL